MKQRVSELMDGELDLRAAEQVMAAVNADEALKEVWNDYHLIGDAMRTVRCNDVDVRAAVSQRLKDEPTVLAPRRWRSRGRVRVAGAAALAASVSFAAVVAWQQLSSDRTQGLDASTVVAQGQRLQSPYDSSGADAYFLAHQEMTADQGIVKVAYNQGASH